MNHHPPRRDLADGSRLFELLDAAAAKLLDLNDPKELAAGLFAMMAEELQLDAYFHYAFGPDGALHLAASAGIEAELAKDGGRLEIGTGVCGCVAQDRRPQHVTWVQNSEDPAHAFIRKAGLQSYACNPMVAGDRLLGTLGFGRRGDTAFRDDELQVLRTLSRYLAVAQERLRTETALLESERRLNAVLNNATVSIFVMDERQQCSFMNAAAEQLTGYTFKEVQGRPLHDVVHHTKPDGSHYPISECPIDRAFPENNQQQGEELFVHKDGHFYPVAFTASPIRDETSHTIGTIIEVRDISAQKRHEEIRELLMHEVDHRARNALTVVQSVVQLTKGRDLAEYKDVVLGRVSALARAQGSLAARRWEGASAMAVVSNELATIAHPAEYRVEGDDWTLAPQEVQPLSMIIHELATNAAKYGALSRESGCVSVRLSSGPDGRSLEWRETGGPPVEEPSRKGFGSRLIGQLARQLGTESVKAWNADGLVASLKLPIG